MAAPEPTLLAAQGFVTVSIFYQLSGDRPFPADIEDCKWAVRYLRANAAKYGIDASRIGVAGASAGGHLAMLVPTAGEDAGLEGGVGLEYRAACRRWRHTMGRRISRRATRKFERRSGRAVVKLFRGMLAEKPEEYRRGSPVTYFRAGDPPPLIVPGERTKSCRTIRQCA